MKPRFVVPLDAVGVRAFDVADVSERPTTHSRKASSNASPTDTTFRADARKVEVLGESKAGCCEPASV